LPMIAPRQDSLAPHSARPDAVAPQNIRKTFERHRVHWLFHCAPLSRLASIFRHGLLPSVPQGSRRGHVRPQTVLSVSHPDTMAMYRIWRDPAVLWMILRLPSYLCWTLNCEFWLHGKPLPGPADMTLGNVFSRNSANPERPDYLPRCWPTDSKLQVRVYEPIPPALVRTVVLRDHSTAQRNAALFKGIEVWIDPSLFCARRPRHFE